MDSNNLHVASQALFPINNKAFPTAGKEYLIICHHPNNKFFRSIYYQI